VSSCSQVFSAETLLRSIHEMTEHFALNANARELPLIHADPKLHISKIAWLVGFNEVSAFTHAFKRWTGKTPSQMRTTAVSLNFVKVGLGE
jgi:AraC-like DNA-binding protein